MFIVRSNVVKLMEKWMNQAEVIDKRIVMQADFIAIKNYLGIVLHFDSFISITQGKDW